jgi:hypothetical protein
MRLASPYTSSAGGDAERAITYLVAAAARAQERSAPRETITCLGTALKLTEHLSDDRQRRQREIEVRIPLISALNLVYGYASDEVRENCEQTRALCEQNGSLPELYEVLCALCYSQQIRAEKDTTRETSKQLVETSGWTARSTGFALPARAEGPPRRRPLPIQALPPSLK